MGLITKYKVFGTHIHTNNRCIWFVNNYFITACILLKCVDYITTWDSHGKRKCIYLMYEVFSHVLHLKVLLYPNFEIIFGSTIS